jgi:flagellar hook-associated protein 3 FlgL
MRVTNQMIFNNAQASTMAARDQVMKAQQQVTSGERVVQPGDDPSAAGLMVSQQIALARLNVTNQAVSQASDEAQVADGALQSVATLVQQAQTLAVQLGNDTYSASERAAGALQIAGISSQISHLMNTQFAGRYIFGGDVDSTPPFDASGNYSGDTAVRQIEVAPGLLQNTSIRADQALKGVGGGVDVFATLSTLAASLSANDGVGVRATVAGLSQANDQVATALAQNGTIMDGFQSAQSIGNVATTSVQKALSSASEADIFQASTDLVAAQTSLQASLAASAKTMSVSLLDYLK